MSNPSPRVCPACRRPARNKPLPPEGFWQEQVLQRIGMYPYRCEACGVRFYRKVPIGKGLGEGRYQTHPHRPAPDRGSGVGEGPAPPRPQRSPGRTPGVAELPEVPDDSLSHEDFVDLVDHISRPGQLEGARAPGKKNEDD